ncbi:MAG: hypothetical protein LAQ69_38575 [Acidobacteriia bacterium]|nr:hypothetical protein [Terriglobia bacterium]
MPAIGPEFTRRALLFAALAAPLRADSADQVWDLISSMASALGNGHAAEFLSVFDPAMPGYQELRGNVTALLSQTEVQSSIDLVSNEGDDRSRTVEIDWLLTMTGSVEVSGAARRQGHVKCRFEKQGRRWRIAGMEPLAFFAPPRAGGNRYNPKEEE